MFKKHVKTVFPLRVANLIGKQIEVRNSQQNMEIHRPKFVRFVSLTAPELPQYRIVNKDGITVHVFSAMLIRLLSDALRVKYDVLSPSDGLMGDQLHGNWSGLIGMIIRSEADLATSVVILTEERYKAMNFTYTHALSRMTFMTDKPQPESKYLAIFYPFSYEIWIALLLLFIAVTVFFYILIKRKQSLQKVMFVTAGSIIEQPLNFKMKTNAFRLLTLTWILGVMILTYSYKATLLSFLSVPPLEGVRDISDLAKASTDSSFKCITYKGSFILRSWLDSSGDKGRAITECLNRNEVESGHVVEAFHNAPPKKAFLGVTDSMTEYKNDYYISEDSFLQNPVAIPFSREFCCQDRLNFVIHQIMASGLLIKINSENDFLSQLQRKSFESSVSETTMKIQLDDLSGAFYILISGWILSFIVFITEILIAKFFPQRH